MRLRFVPDWRRVMTRAWSMRLIAAAVVLTGIETFLACADGYLFTDAPRGYFAGASAIVGALAAWARLVAQANISGDRQ